MKNGMQKLLLVTVIGAFALGGCASTMQYGDAGSAKPISTEFGSSDLQQIAEAMVDSMIIFPPMVELTSARRPVVSVDKVKNKTMQHIDTESITDSIRTKLIRSGKFRFIDRTTDDQTIEELKTQQDSGLVDKKTAVQFGQQIGAEFLLTSNFSEIRQKVGSTTDVYYKFTMSLKNLKTGILEWSDEKEIRKVFTRGTFGG
ncbi:MAG: penicillin-binding protein activator LpoB [Desulfuromonadaceae bacterium]|nr:penicillin-binding protein activator LpoB [Desulfuromonadaceae bacterium]MDD2847740.1 penicillin-binding protein activator LpoB [Desulfuromonadaceae bacterium]MDD4131014.1 penicillin-binding protein activator LpoB [Desulfuromonadaceae bacterium]